MAVTLNTYNQTTRLVGGQLINLANLKIANLSSSGTFDATHQTISDVTGGSSATVTLPTASPGVVGWTAHGLAADTPVMFSRSATLPTGLAPATVYYVLAAGLTTNGFRVSATKGGAAIDFTGSPAGTFKGFSIGAKEISGYGWPTGGVTIPNVAVTSEAISSAAVNDAMFDGDDMSVDAAGDFIRAWHQVLYDAVTGAVLIHADLGEEVKAGDTTPFKIRLSALGFLNLVLPES